MNPGPTGSAHLLTAPYQAFPTRDGWINVGGANQANWERIVKVIGSPELANDTRFRTNVGIGYGTSTHSRPSSRDGCERERPREWLRVLDAEGVPAGPVNKIGDTLNDPQVLARDMVVEVDHPKAGRVKSLGIRVGKFLRHAAKRTQPRALRSWASTRAKCSRAFCHSNTEIDKARTSRTAAVLVAT